MLQAIIPTGVNPFCESCSDDRSAAAAPRKPADRVGAADSVDLSAAATEQLSAAGAPRTALIERIRTSIAAGTYLSNDRIDKTVDRIMEEVLHRPTANAQLSSGV